MTRSERLHRCWWHMLETKCVGDNFEMLLTVLAIMVTNINYLFTLALGTNIKKIHQHRNSVTNIQKSSPILGYQHDCHRSERQSAKDGRQVWFMEDFDSLGSLTYSMQHTALICLLVMTVRNFEIRILELRLKTHFRFCWFDSFEKMICQFVETKKSLSIDFLSECEVG